MRSQSFLKGTAVLAVAGIASKALGALFAIPLTRLIGAEGVGLLHMASPVFATVLVLCVSGFPVAASKLVSERLAKGSRGGARQVLFVCLAIMLPLSAAFSLVLYRGAGFIATVIIKDPRAFFPLKYMSPAVAIVTCSASLRAYFQGYRTMTPTAISSVAEQTTRVAVGLGLAYLLLPRGVQWAAAGAAMGTCIAAAGGLLVLIGFLIALERDPGVAGKTPPTVFGVGGDPLRHSVPFRATAQELVRLAWPVTIAALVGPLLEAANAAIVPARLQEAGFSVSRSAELYGRLSGMAMSLVSIPGVLTTAMAVSLIPQVAAARAIGDSRRAKHLARQAVRGALLVGVPAAVGLAVLPVEICALLFDDPGGGIPLSMMAFAAAFLCLQQTTAGVLNGLGKVHIPALNGLLGAVVATCVNYALTAIPEIGIRGAALGTGIGFLVAGALNTIAAGRLSGEGVRVVELAWRTLLGSAVMAPTVKSVYRILLALTYSNAISTTAAIIAGTAMYGSMLILLGELGSRELAYIPLLGRPLASILCAVGILRR